MKAIGWYQRVANVLRDSKDDTRSNEPVSWTSMADGLGILLKALKTD